MGMIERPEGWLRTATALRSAREASGRTLSDVAERTRIAARHLTAIEESRFDALPASVFALGFTRSYARELGLAEAPLVQAIRDGITVPPAAASGARGWWGGATDRLAGR